MANGFTASYSGAKASNKAYQILNSSQGTKLSTVFVPTINVVGPYGEGRTTADVPVTQREAPLIVQIPENLRSGVYPEGNFDSQLERLASTQGAIQQGSILSGNNTILLVLGAGIILFLVYGRN